ncbi:hypothetical protein C9415_10325 [Kluyvera sp. Nf5]|nr:hypothetical protein C9415_10325 [Kluyvera sp. Nf5]
MSTVTPITSAQQRQFDRQQLLTIDAALQANEEARNRLQEARRELVNRLGLNKPDGPEVA